MRSIDAGRHEAPSSVEKRKPSSVPAYKPLGDAEMFISFSGASPLRVHVRPLSVLLVDAIGDTVQALSVRRADGQQP
jgi:hypothetical protein